MQKLRLFPPKGRGYERRWSRVGAGAGQEGILRPFAQRCAELVSKGPFFTFCVALVVVWAPTILFTDFDTWQLLINTPTTIITFLLVALLQSTQRRDELAIHKKLDAIADGMADLMR